MWLGTRADPSTGRVPGPSLPHGRLPGVRVQKLGSTDGFVLIDLEAADHAVGVVRLAPKILVDGATWLARSGTYQWASFERKVSGASAGINARPDARAAAIAAFVAEVGPQVESGTFLPSAGKGLSAADLAPLATLDPRGPLVPSREAALAAASVAASVAHAIPGAGGSRVVVEGLDAGAADGAALLTRLAADGAVVVAASTAAGGVADPGGLDVGALGDALAAGADLPGPPLDAGAPILAVDADVVVAGSKAGVVDHVAAATVTAKALVPSGPIPVTAKGLAVLRRAGVVVLPDFVTTAGPVMGSWPSEAVDLAAGEQAAADAVTAVLAEVAGHPNGPLLGAAARAEAFLASWVDELPFGRPLA